MLDFCIIGAPKSGTTSLFNWLDAHPALQGATPKETHFFMDSDHPLCGICGADYHNDGPTAYARFFPDNHARGQRFEATTQYFYQKTARDQLASLQPQPRIIMLLREPASKILSSFRFTRDNLAYCDSALTFDHYVDCLLNDQAAELDQYFHADGSLYIAKRELELSRYVDWLNSWSEVFESSRLIPVLFEELKRDPHAIMERLCTQLGIDAGFYDDFGFGQDNATYPVGNQAVHRILRPLGAHLPGGTLKDYLKDRYLAWQRAKSTPDHSYEQGVAALKAYFKPSNRELAHHYGLDIEHWWGKDSLSQQATADSATG